MRFLNLNLLVIFFPIAFVLEYTHGAALLIFLASALAIVPLSGWLGHELALHTGATIGGLLNATFGSATELIIAFFVLSVGQVDIIVEILPHEVLHLNPPAFGI